ncbi:hypothetical protein [Pararhodobacter aggregans]|uniref:hypothetical protein n=1 Tax=Pararhodobacter aggregans TaxID=404875 RepID=UPI003A90577B
MAYMTRTLPALAVALSSASPILAATEFRGGGFLTDFANCATTGWTGTERVLVRFRPAGAEGNSTTITRVSMITYSGAMNFSFAYAPGTYPEVGEWFPVTTTRIFGSAGQVDGVEMRILESSPIEAIAGGATALFANFELRNFDGDPGCWVRGRIALALD